MRLPFGPFDARICYYCYDDYYLFIPSKQAASKHEPANQPASITYLLLHVCTMTTHYVPAVTRQRVCAVQVFYLDTKYLSRKQQQ